MAYRRYCSVACKKQDVYARQTVPVVLASERIATELHFETEFLSLVVELDIRRQSQTASSSGGPARGAPLLLENGAVATSNEGAGETGDGGSGGATAAEDGGTEGAVPCSTTAGGDHSAAPPAAVAGSDGPTARDGPTANGGAAQGEPLQK